MQVRNTIGLYRRLIIRFLVAILFSGLLMSSQCNSDDEEDIIEPELSEVKSTYRVEGLDDSFYKEYEAYTYFDIDTTSDGDTLSVFFTPHERNNIELSFFTEEAYTTGIYSDWIGKTGTTFSGTVEFDNIFTVYDSAKLEVKSFENNIMVASVEIIASTSKKSYRISAEEIIATSKGYIIPE